MCPTSFHPSGQSNLNGYNYSAQAYFWIGMLFGEFGCGLSIKILQSGTYFLHIHFEKEVIIKQVIIK